MNVADVIIKIKGDNSDFKSALDDSASSTEDFSLSLTSIAAIATAAFAVVSAAVYKSLDAYKESEAASNKLALSLQNQGLYSKQLLEAYKDQAAELQRLTGIDDDSIIKGQAQLQSMIGRVKITKEMSAAAVDLGAALGGDASAGFEVLGRAIDGNSRGLKQLGIEIDEHLTREERTQQILQKVAQSYGGLAITQNQGLGSARGLKSAIGDLAEDFGARLAPAVSGATKMLTEFFQSLHDKNVKAADPLEQIDVKIKNMKGSIESLKTTGSFSGLNADQLTASLKEANKQLELLGIVRDDIIKGRRGSRLEQDPAKEAAAKKAQQIELRTESEERESRKIHLEALREQRSQASAEVVKITNDESETLAKLSQEKNQAQRDALSQHLADIRIQKQEAMAADAEDEQTLKDDILAKNEEYQTLTAEQQSQFREQNAVALKASLDNESQALSSAALTKAKIQATENNRFLADKQKHNAAYATLNRFMHSEELQGAATAAGELAQLTQSQNSTLKAIGKVAAVADITIKTAKSAMNVFEGMTAAIPGPVGVSLGIAGAAAAVAFGGEKIALALSAADGGLITGGITGRDSVPAMLMPGELVVPSRNYSEVVNAVASQRNQLGENAGAVGGVGGGSMQVLIGFDGSEAEQVITARQTEARSLGTLRSSA